MLFKNNEKKNFSDVVNAEGFAAGKACWGVS